MQTAHYTHAHTWHAHKYIHVLTGTHNTHICYADNTLHARTHVDILTSQLHFRVMLQLPYTKIIYLGHDCLYLSEHWFQPKFGYSSLSLILTLYFLFFYWYISVYFSVILIVGILLSFAGPVVQNKRDSSEGTWMDPEGDHNVRSSWSGGCWLSHRHEVGFYEQTRWWQVGFRLICFLLAITLFNITVLWSTWARFWCAYVCVSLCVCVCVSALCVCVSVFLHVRFSVSEWFGVCVCERERERTVVSSNVFCVLNISALCSLMRGADNYSLLLY